MTSPLLHPYRVVELSALTLIAVMASSCGEIVGPEHVKCTMFASGETFTAEKRNMRVEGGFLYVVDDQGKVHAFRMIDSSSNAYVGRCEPIAERHEVMK